MANLKITINSVLMDGHEVTFKAPCDCTAFENLDVHYVENQTQKNKLFALKDAHGNSLKGIGNLFTQGAYVHVILNTVDGVAYLQNSDTNGYLEKKFDGYLPLSGGTLRGTSPNIGFMVDGREWVGSSVGVRSDGGMFMSSDKYVDLTTPKGSIRYNDELFAPPNDTLYLGGSSYKWKAVYAVQGTIQTSDRNQKENILDIDPRYEELFGKLKPVTFELSGASHDRVHVGFVSQDVKEAMDDVGLSDMEFAGYCVDAKTKIDEETQEKVAVLDEKGNPIKLYSLRYSEFIALNTHMIQKLQAEIQTLKEEIAILKK